MNRGNPTLSSEAFRRDVSAVDSQAGVMTLSGTIKKTGFLMALVLMTGIIGYKFPVLPLMVGMVFFCLVLGLVIGFKPRIAPVGAPIYALAQGYFVGAISFVMQAEMTRAVESGKSQYQALAGSAIPIAMFGTILTLGIMLFLYAKRIIVVTDTMRSVIVGATLAVGITYLVCFLGSLFAPSFFNGLAIFQGGPIGIVFSIFVIGLAAFNFLLDFSFIEEGVESRAPGHYEWYAAFGLMVTIVWLYIEILRLIRKIVAR